MMIGINMAIFAFLIWLINITVNLLKPLGHFGKVPFFFYILHLLIYSLISLFFQITSPQWLITILWVVSLIVFYPFIVIYGKFRKSRTQKSIIRYL